MPEVAELKHSRDRLRQALVGRWLSKFDLVSNSRFGRKIPDGHPAFVGSLPCSVKAIDTRGKFMWWTVESRDGIEWYVWCTYGMSGQWSTQRSKHTAATVAFVDIDGSHRAIHFNDPRHFGTLKFVNDKKQHERKLASLGPCVLESPVDPRIFAERLLKKPNRTIVEALMDQSGVAGVGNYIKAEAIYRAGISPWRKVLELQSSDWSKLHHEVVAVARESYNSQGASIRTYRTVDGDPGEGQFFFRVYGKKNCPLGHQVTRDETPDGRTTHWCPICQM